MFRILWAYNKTKQAMPTLMHAYKPKQKMLTLMHACWLISHSKHRLKWFKQYIGGNQNKYFIKLMKMQ